MTILKSRNIAVEFFHSFKKDVITIILLRKFVARSFFLNLGTAVTSVERGVLLDAIWGLQPINPCSKWCHCDILFKFYWRHQINVNKIFQNVTLTSMMSSLVTTIWRILVMSVSLGQYDIIIFYSNYIYLTSKIRCPRTGKCFGINPIKIP